MLKKNAVKVLIVGLIMAAGGSILGQAGNVAKNSALNKVQVKRDMQVFERILDTRLKQLFPNPYALIEGAKGAYLNGYGVAFAFRVNINRATAIQTPFGPISSNKEESPQDKHRKIEEVKVELVRAIAEHAHAIGQLKPEDSVAIIAHFEDNSVLNEVNRIRTVVLRVLKRDLNEYNARKDFAAFQRRVEILEY